MSVRWLIRNRNTVLTFTSATEAVAAIVGEYSNAEDETALLARYRLAVDVACHRQAVLAAEAHRRGDIDVTEMSEKQLTALFADRQLEPIVLTEPWDLDVPLVLIETDFAPFTSRPRPRGRIIWLSPQSEPEFLRSLADIGVLDEIHVHEVP